MPPRVGCTGWGYDDWVGPFYPPGTPSGEWLRQYARVFDTVEVDSSFYAAPPRERIERWAAETPPGFTFHLKVPRAVTHDSKLEDLPAFHRFVASLEPLERAGKLGAVVAQLPPSFRRAKHAAAFEAFLAAKPPALRLAIELRSDTWWLPETFRALEAAKASLVWNVQPDAKPPPEITGDFLYVRFIGDRAIEKFDRIQRDLRAEIEAMRDRLAAAGLGPRDVFLLVNNHFMGYAPGTANLVREVFGLPALDLGAAGRPKGQRGLGEF